ncbi:AMP-binding protein [Spongiactinospora sp. TRM90649]|uniref:AMP-binding protein n=1 Tax=Spongiactinospora sp. TRM90649 TaxID=3031114 RepID=UPI0023F74438|nr:AMP-binding protein [Spongiactinospora sp. TRM90649]MDF5758297.1 AMP-binding protein [Spongiactinospora sp. TRM90649]
MRGQLPEGVRTGRHGPVTDLIEAEADHPDRVLLRRPGAEWTVGEFAGAARRCAAELRARGVGPGDHVAIVSGNSEWRLAWQYGAWWIGAVEVSVNAELKGPLMAFVLSDCDPVLLVAERELLDRLGDDPPAPVRVIDDGPPEPIGAAERAELDEANAATRAGDLGTILYTSGTTGRSKGVMLPRAYFSNLGAVVSGVLGLGPGDTGYFVLPFFHVDFHIVFPAVVQSGSAVAFDRRFSAQRFWPQIAGFECTWAFVIGAVLSVVMTLGREAASGTPLRRFLGAPIPAEAYPFFEDDLGVRIQSMFGQTEADGPTFETPARRRRGSAGWPCAGFDVEIHDEEGRPLPPGTAGEIVYRPQHPDMITLGYWRRDDATVEAWRGLWFHSGDLGRMDEDGFLYFVGRLTDSMRRRGENVSAYELESVIRTAPGVGECAAIGVTDEMGGEDEIKVFVVPDGPADFDVLAFFRFCEDNLPRYALPRYVELTTSGAFVRSVGTGVVQKRLLSTATTGPTVHERANDRPRGGDREEGR